MPFYIKEQSTKVEGTQQFYVIELLRTPGLGVELNEEVVGRLAKGSWAAAAS